MSKVPQLAIIVTYLYGNGFRAMERPIDFTKVLLDDINAQIKIAQLTNTDNA